MNPIIIEYYCNRFSTETELKKWALTNRLQHHAIVKNRLSIIQNRKNREKTKIPQSNIQTGQERQPDNLTQVPEINQTCKICQKINGDNYQQRFQLRNKLAYQTGIYILISKLFVLLII